MSIDSRLDFRMRTGDGGDTFWLDAVELKHVVSWDGMGWGSVR